MSDNSKIEWCDASWSPVRARNRATGKPGWYCIHASPGCEHCYAETLNRRLGTGTGYRAQDQDQVEIYLDDQALVIPLRWRRPRRIFVCSMTDLFGEWVTDAMLDRIFAVMALCPQHRFLVLTKRAKRMRGYCAEPQTPKRITAAAFSPARIKWPLPNVWLGVSVEDQRRADERIPKLLATPAAVRWISAEPLLGPVDLRNLVIPRVYGSGLLDAFTLDFKTHHQEVIAGPPKGHGPLDWVVAGGESGPGARPMHPEWARWVRDQCTAAGVPFFFKQWGEWLPRSQRVSQPLPKGEWGTIEPAGRYFSTATPWNGHDDDDPGAGAVVWKIGKRAAGRTLDRREWNEFPASSAA